MTLLIVGSAPNPTLSINRGIYPNGFSNESETLLMIYVGEVRFPMVKIKCKVCALCV